MNETKSLNSAWLKMNRPLHQRIERFFRDRRPKAEREISGHTSFDRIVGPGPFDDVQVEDDVALPCSEEGGDLRHADHALLEVAEHLIRFARDRVASQGKPATNEMVLAPFHVRLLSD